MAGKRRTASSATRDRSGWWLVCVHDESARALELLAYRALEREVGRLRAGLDGFEKRDVSAFAEWEDRTFRATLTRIGELESGISEQLRLLEKIADEARCSGCSRVTAYRRVMDGAGTPSSEEAVEDRDTSPDEKRAQSDGGWRGQSLAAPTDRRVKALYRQLVRQLHPDGKATFGARERDLWHEVQAAYQDRDLERLVALAGRVELVNGGDSEGLPLGTLRRMTADLGRDLLALKVKTTQAKRQLAWGFRRLTKRKGIEATRRVQLERREAETREEFRLVAAELDVLARRAERGKRPSRRAGR